MSCPEMSPSTPALTPSKRRRSRIERSKHPPPMRGVSERMGCAVAFVQRVKVASRDQVQHYCGYPSRNTANRDLGRLFHHGYLARRFTPPVAGQPKGDHQALYLLDRKGAEYLAAQRGLARWQDLGWKPRDNDLSEWHLNHLVAVNELIVSLSLAARQTACQVGWLAEWELRQPERKCRVDVVRPGGGHKQVTVIADAYVVLHPPGGQRWAFFLECDRGTVDLRTRWREKLLGYEALLRSPAYERSFPIGPHTVGVLAVTVSAPRLAHLKALAERVSPAGFFLFALFSEATSSAILTQPVWQISHRQGSHPLLPGVGAGR